MAEGDSLDVQMKYGTTLHSRIKSMLTQNRKYSQNKMSQYYSKWDDADDSFRAYQPVNSKDYVRKSVRHSGDGTHDYVTLTVPYTYAIVMTAHTYWSSVFLSRSPVYQLQGRHGEAQDSVEAFEACLEYQLTVGRHLVPLYNWLFDGGKYGLGINGTYWCREEAIISRLIEQQASLMGIPLPGKTKKVWQHVPVLNYEGNKLYNVRPYDFFPDPRVALCNFQDGEFCGRDTQVGWHEILEGQRQGYYFNIDTLAQKINTGTYDDSYKGSGRVELPDQVNQGRTMNAEQPPGPGFVHLHEQSVRLIPRVKGLSPIDRVQKWNFTLANGDVVIGARPAEEMHNQFPYNVVEYGLGAHEFIKMGMVEVMDPLSETLSWLINSHFYNVRKALNDQRVVDPSRVVMKDFDSPVTRGVIRLKPTAYGTDTRTAISQLTTMDMTRTHLGDMGFVEEIIQRVTGVVDQIMGLSDGPSRESATGVRSRTGFAANRLKTTAEYWSALGFAPMIEQMVCNTQQFMQDAQKFRIAGASAMSVAKRFIQVDPQSIAGRYDFVPVDGTLPIDRLAQANFWKELTMQLAQSPVLAPQWDLNGLVAHIMHLQGEKNIDRFRVQVVPDSQVQQQLQAGNIIPIGGKGGQRQLGQPAGGSTGATL